MSGEEKLNLGCLYDIKEGWVNLDRKQFGDVDVIHDLNETPWPFEDNRFKKVYASHVLEHLDSVERTIKEICRVCKRGAEVEIWSPHFTSADAYADEDHEYPGFSVKFLDYYADDEYVPDYGDRGLIRVDTLHLRFNKRAYPWNIVVEKIANLSPRWWEQSPLRIFPANDIHVIATVLQDQ